MREEKIINKAMDLEDLKSDQAQAIVDEPVRETQMNREASHLHSTTIGAPLEFGCNG